MFNYEAIKYSNYYSARTDMNFLQVYFDVLN